VRLTRRDRFARLALTGAGDSSGIAEPIDHAHRFVAEHEFRLHRVLTFHDVHVRAAYRRRRNADDGLTGSRHRLLSLLDFDDSGATEGDRFHRIHDVLAGL
jgi:hypothetical protein